MKGPFAIVGAGFLGLALAIPAGASGSGWSKVPSPNPLSPIGQLISVSCPGVSDCMAVGGYVTGSGVGATLAERWNGSTWIRLPIPNAPGAPWNRLFGVSCASSSACIAVGDYIDSSGGPFLPLAERWNGTAWSIQSTPIPAGLQGVTAFGAPVGPFAAVSCTSASACTAVGGYNNAADVGVTLAERWNGTTWSIESTPNPSGAQSSYLDGVSCTSSTVCTAVGAWDQDTLAEHWDGTTWSLQSTPSAGQGANLTSVSCTSSSACVAVGNYFKVSGVGVTLAEGWNGSTWTVQSTPNPAASPFSLFFSVSCSSASSCTAVGWFNDSSRQLLTLTERWNGTTWLIQATPTVGDRSILTGVACPEASTCVAVGRRPHVSGTLATLAERWNGTRWNVQPTVNPEGDRGAQLMGVSCISSSSCVAVGQSTGGTLAELWDGITWSIVPTPNPAGAAGSGLGGVSCTSPSACTAVGTAFDSSGNPLGTVAERWNGTTWTIQATPTSARPGYFINAVSCTSATACTAVGNTDSGPLAERWNGTIWTVQAMPAPPGAAFSFLVGVSCTSAVTCTAVGGAFDSFGNPLGTLTERWNGTTWSIQSTATSASPGYFLGAVSCTSAPACTAVGNTDSGLLAERWDGTTWSIQSVPTPIGTKGNGDFFSGVSCSSALACTAVGLAFSPFPPITVAERWDGTQWRIQSTPSLVAYDIDAPGVSCPALLACMAVGGYTNDGPKVTLAEQWNGHGGSGAVVGPSVVARGLNFSVCARPSLREASGAPAQTFSSPWSRVGVGASPPFGWANSSGIGALKRC